MNQATISTSIVQPTKSDSINDTQVLFKVSLQVIGIKKRCRKSERHFFQLGHIPYNEGEYDHEAMKQKARDFLSTNMKEVNSQIRVYLERVVVSNEGSFTVTQSEPFSKLNKSFDFSL
jgi:hypothetical protein